MNEQQNNMMMEEVEMKLCAGGTFCWFRTLLTSTMSAADRIDAGPITPTCSQLPLPSHYVCSSGKSCDISKCLPTLAGLSRHPDSSHGAFEEVHHTVEIYV